MLCDEKIVVSFVDEVGVIYAVSVYAGFVFVSLLTKANCQE